MTNALRLSALALALTLAFQPAASQTPPQTQAGLAALSAPIALPGPVPRGFSRTVLAGERVRQKVFVPSYRVAFTVATGARAATRGTSFGDTQRASAAAGLVGVDEAMLQAITERALADLKERLTQAGFEVVPVETWKAVPGAADLQVGPATIAYKASQQAGSAQTYAIVNPASLGAWPETAMPVNLGPVRRMTGALEATMLSPRFNVNFAYVQAERGRMSLLPSAPRASLTPGIHAAPVIAGFGLATWGARVGQHGGFMEYKVDGSLPAPGTFDRAGSSGTQRVDTSGARMWGPTQVSLEERYEVDPEAYARLALQVLALQNQIAVDELARARR